MPTQTKPFTKTAKQREARDLLKSEARHILLYGGARSGKPPFLLPPFISCLEDISLE